ncbi:MAG: hypothetical protein N2045_13675 [Fimbriimonadales bacterium]|nr:hypothetical protein [Fimbriimonadales bacterium]
MGVVIEPRVTVYQVEVLGQPVTVVESGGPATIIETLQQGPSGAAGDAEIRTIPFAYNNVTPFPVLQLPYAVLVRSAAIHIRTAFNGAGAALELGIAGQPGLLIPANRNLPNRINQYRTNPDAELAPNTQILLTITPGGGATQGQGVITLELSKL